MKSKIHAKEYLKEYAIGKAEWVITLIEKVILANDRLTEKEKEQLFIQLLKENNLTDGSPIQLNGKNSESEVNPDNEESTGSRLTFKNITHVGGVNALMGNQSIDFSDSCTIIFGLNGTGKSGYFRVINEITGAKREKDILGNIYTDDQDIEVSIEYLLDTTAHSMTWDNSQRAIPPFTQAEVFDSDHLPIFLNEKESTVNIEPLGLHLFKATTDIIDEFKEKLQGKAKHYRQQAPDISLLVQVLKSQNLVSVLNKNNLTKEDEKYIKKKGVFTATDKKRLEKFTAQKSTLEKSNSSDKIIVLTREKDDIKNLLNHLNNIKQQISNHVDKVKPTIEKCQAKKNRRDERVKEFEALNNIPKQNSEEWQAFVDSAVEYEKQIDKSEFNSDEFCIYCHQPFKTQEALNLVKTYSKYLEDQSQREFTMSVQSLNVINDALGNISTDYKFPYGLSLILNSTNSQLTEKTNQYLKSAINTVQELREKINNQDISENTFETDNFDEIASQINGLIEGRISTINNLRASNQDKAKKIQKLQEIIDKLSDKKLLSEWLNKVQENFKANKLSGKYSVVAEKINTAGVTKLASTAHDELLTETIRSAFQDELQGLGKTLAVSINKTRADKGRIRTRLEIEGNNVGDILSEGEQKAVALALFIAEVRCQDKNFPVVFDDPVTSLDHKIAHELAKKLLLLSKDKQVIIFTHNKLFFNSLIHWSKHLKESDNSKSYHVCKNYSASGCDGVGKHVLTYELQKLGKLETGKVHQAQILSLSYHLNKAKQQIASNEEVSQVSASLKSAIEYFIDKNILLIGSMKERIDKDNIPWEQLGKLESKSEILKQLKTHWDKLSSRGTHLSYSSTENPLNTEELQEIVDFLEQN